MVSVEATTNNQNLIGTLSAAGLTQNQAKVYLAVLELGSSSIWRIAEKSGIKRPTCYDILEELSLRGLATQTHDSKKILYSVISPRQLVRLSEMKYQKLSNSVSQLEALASLSADKPKVQLYEGLDGIKQAYELILEMPRGSEFLMLGTSMLFSGLNEYIAEEFMSMRHQKGIMARSIFADTVENRSTFLDYKIKSHSPRFLPADKYIQRTQTGIFGDMILFIAHSEGEPFATLLQSSALAFDEKVRFEFLWDIAKE